MGLSADDLNKQFQQAELQAQAALKANEYLANILATLQGKPIAALSATDSVIGGKPTATQAKPTENSTQLDEIHAALLTIAQAVREGTITAQSGSRAVVDAISTRSVRESAAQKAGPRTQQPPRVSLPA